MEKTRKFRVGEGRRLFLPAALTEGTHNTRVDSGDIVELAGARLRKFQRYVNNLIQWGDFVEVTDATTASSPAKAKE